MRFLVTGANGFIGQYLCADLFRRGHSVRAAVRFASMRIDNAEVVAVDRIDGETDWGKALCGVDVVIHLAARVHVMKEVAADPLAEFLRVNVQGTENLAYQAAAAGVKRLVYVSSIKVNGERSISSHPFTELDAPDPQEAYAISKWRAEQCLQDIAQKTGLEIAILRPPLVYGPYVKGNFIQLLDVVNQGLPLPLANIRNKRSLIYLGNLADALIACSLHPAAAGKIYLVRDGDDIAIPDLVRLISKYLGRRVTLFALPLIVLRWVGGLMGKRESIERLVDSLRVDDSLIRAELGWRPAYTLYQGLEATAEWYRAQLGSSGPSYLAKRQDTTGLDCDVSIVIVNYNAGEILLKCIASAQQQAGQVIVVDNASTDNSVAALTHAYPAVRLICNERNLGFASACNRGAKAADGKYLLFLNPDCILEPNAVSALLEAVNSEPDVGMVGGLLTDADGTEQSGGRRSIPTPWRSFVRAFGFGALRNRYPKLFSDFELHRQPLPRQPVEVEAISGACMLVRRTALEEVGLLDEGYFMHCEDLDWCMRFRQQGWKILFVPGARMVHYKGHCSKSRPIFVEWNKHKGMVRFYRKFFRHQYPGLLMVLVVMAVWLRFAAIAAYYMLARLLRRPILRHD